MFSLLFIILTIINIAAIEKYKVRQWKVKESNKTQMQARRAGF